MSAKAEPPRQLVRFRGGSYVAFVFSPVMPIVGWLEELDATLTRSPGFFAGRPVVLDLSAVELGESAIAHLISSLRSATSACSASKAWMRVNWVRACRRY